MPEAKNGERPYLAVPEATFLGPFLAGFLALFVAFLFPTKHFNPPLFYFVL